MNEEKPSLQDTISSLLKKEPLTKSTGAHLDVLHKQTDPEKKVIPQGPLNTNSIENQNTANKIPTIPTNNPIYPKTNTNSSDIYRENPYEGQTSTNKIVNNPFQTQNKNDGFKNQTIPIQNQNTPISNPIANNPNSFVNTDNTTNTNTAKTNNTGFSNIPITKITEIPKNTGVQENINAIKPDINAEIKTNSANVLQKPIRTFEGDVAEALANKRNSVITMAIAENKKGSGSERLSNKASSNIGKKIFITINSLIIIALGLGGGYYLYLQSPLAIKDKPKNDSRLPSIIQTDLQRIVPIKDLKDSSLDQKIHDIIFSENIESEKTSEFILTQTIASSTQRITSVQFINALDLNIPDSMKRTLTKDWVLGIFGYDQEKLPFIILTTDYFQNAYAGMLKWEQEMPRELATLLDYKEKALSLIETSSTTNTALKIRGRFEDRTIQNRDVREFRNERGELYLLYSFIDKNTLVIATSEATLKNLIGKIENQTYIR